MLEYIWERYGDNYTIVFDTVPIGNELVQFILVRDVISGKDIQFDEPYMENLVKNYKPGWIRLYPKCGSATNIAGVVVDEDGKCFATKIDPKSDFWTQAQKLSEKIEAN